jgi:hypothetical protein
VTGHSHPPSSTPTRAGWRQLLHLGPSCFLLVCWFVVGLVVFFSFFGGGGRPWFFLRLHVHRPISVFVD